MQPLNKLKTRHIPNWFKMAEKYDYMTQMNHAKFVASTPTSTRVTALCIFTEIMTLILGPLGYTSQ